MCLFVEAQWSLCTDVDGQWCTSPNPDLSFLVVTAPFESKQKTRVHTPIALHQVAPSAHVGSEARFSVDSLMEEISARLNALEQGVRDRDARIQHLNTMLQQSALQAQSWTTAVPQPDPHRDMLARVKEFDGDDDKWPGWWFKLQSFLKANHLGYEGMIDRIVAEIDVAKLNNAVLSAAEKKLSTSLYYVLGLTMTDESKSLNIVRNVADSEGAIALHKLLAEYQPEIVNRHLGLLMWTMNWSIRPTDPVTAINELDLRMNACELQSGEKMADTLKRGVLLKGLAPLLEVQKHVMKDSARLNTYTQMRAEVVDLLRAEAALHMPMDVDGALTGSKAKGKAKGKGKPDDQKGKGKAKGKGKKGKETRVCHECNKPGHLRKDCTVYKKRMAEKGGNKEKTDRQQQCKEQWSKREYTEDD